MNYRHNQKAYELVSGVKDLESLKAYGLSPDEIAELQGIKKEGRRQIKEVRTQMKEAFEEMQQEEGGSSSDEEASAFARRGPRKSRYCIKCDLPGGFKVRIDHCLCARLILAGSLLTMIFFVFWIMLTAKFHHKDSNQSLASADEGDDEDEV